MAGSRGSSSRENRGGFCGVCTLACPVKNSPDGGHDTFCCAECGVRVHRLCYFIPNHVTNTSEWRCDPCRINKKTPLSRAPTCELCPSYGGALKQIVEDDESVTPSSKSKFAHVQCAIFIPNTSINVKRGGVIRGVKDIPRDRYNLKCTYCSKKNPKVRGLTSVGGANGQRGACAQCALGKCTTAFHVSCAVRHGRKLDWVQYINSTYAEAAGLDRGGAVPRIPAVYCEKCEKRHVVVAPTSYDSLRSGDRVYGKWTDNRIYKGLLSVTERNEFSVMFEGEDVFCDGILEEDFVDFDPKTRLCPSPHCNRPLWHEGAHMHVSSPIAKKQMECGIHHYQECQVKWKDGVTYAAGLTRVVKRRFYKVVFDDGLKLTTERRSYIWSVAEAGELLESGKLSISAFEEFYPATLAIVDKLRKSGKQ